MRRESPYLTFITAEPAMSDPVAPGDVSKIEDDTARIAAPIPLEVVSERGFLQPQLEEVLGRLREALNNDRLLADPDQVRQLLSGIQGMVEGVISNEEAARIEYQTQLRALTDRVRQLEEILCGQSSQSEIVRVFFLYDGSRGCADSSFRVRQSGSSNIFGVYRDVFSRHAFSGSGSSR